MYPRATGSQGDIMKRLLTACFGLILAALTAGVGPGIANSHAQAARVCKVSGQVKFSPPLGQTTRTTDHIYKNADTRVKTCTLNTSTGTFAGTLTGQGSCSRANAKGTWTFTWSSGPKSKASISFKTTGGGKAKITGTVTSGQLKGSTVSGTLTYTVVKGSCSSGPGVSLASFKGKLAI